MDALRREPLTPSLLAGNRRDPVFEIPAAALVQDLGDDAGTVVVAFFPPQMTEAVQMPGAISRVPQDPGDVDRVAVPVAILVLAGELDRAWRTGPDRDQMHLAVDKGGLVTDVLRFPRGWACREVLALDRRSGTFHLRLVRPTLDRRSRRLRFRRCV